MKIVIGSTWTLPIIGKCRCYGGCIASANTTGDDDIAYLQTSEGERISIGVKAAELLGATQVEQPS